MILLAPVWLFLLLPWGATCFWAGRADGRRAAVPHLPLWPRTPGVAGRRRRVPPGWVMLLLAAGLLAILAAAGPAVVRPATTVTLLVDRGPSMSAPRRREAAGRLRLAALTRVRVVAAGLDDIDTNGGGLDAVLDGIPVNPLATAEELQETVNRESRLGPVVVLTDRPDSAAVRASDPMRVAWVGPGRAVVNAGIDQFAVVPGTPGQAMVRVFNGTGLRRAVVRVDAQALSVDLPAAGLTADYFLDLPGLGTTAVATLEGADGQAWVDDVPDDDKAMLVRTVRPAQLVPRTALDTSLARMTAVYAARRVPDADAPAVAIVRGPPPDGPAVILPDALEAVAEPGGLTIDGTHPLAHAVDFTNVAEAACSAAGPPAGGWTAVVSNGSRVLVAVRDRPARQAWVGFDTAVLAHRPDYVIFWTNVFDYVAGGAPVWTPDPARLSRAVRPAPLLPPVTGGASRIGQREISLVSPALLLALSLAAAGLWIGFRLTHS